MIDKGWIEAGNLTESDVLLCSNGSYGKIDCINIECFDYYIDVYNFEVEQFHTYFVGENSIFVHNAACGGMNNLRLLKTTKVKGYRISMDLEKGGSKKNNIHLLVNGVKYYYKNSKFIFKAGKEIPKKSRNNSTINDALAKALYLIKNGWRYYEK